MSEIKLNPSDLDFTQNKRKALIEKMEKIQGGIEEDSELIGAYTRLLDGIDKQELSKMKIKSDEEQGDKNRAAIQAARQLATSFSRQRTNPFLAPREGGVPIDHVIKTFETDEEHIAEVQPGQPPMNWIKFEKKMTEEDNGE